VEEEFNIQLFSREAYRPVLTEVNKAFHKESQLAVKKFRELEKFATELGLGYETEISISIDAIFPLNEISSFLKEFFQTNTATRLKLSTDILDGLNDKLLNHEVDFAIGSNIQKNPEFVYIKLLSTSMIPVISASFYEEHEGTLEDLYKYPQIIVSSSSNSVSNKIIGAVDGMKQWFTSDMSMKEQLISNGLGWGRLPSHQVKEKLENGSLVAIKNLSDTLPIEIPLYLLKNKDKVMGPNTKKLWNFLIDKCNQEHTASYI